MERKSKFIRKERQKGITPEKMLEEVLEKTEANAKKRAAARPNTPKEVSIGLAADLPPVKYLSTGVGSLDHLLGGGFLSGNITIVYGPPGSGKTTLCLLATAANQSKGLSVVWIDAERKFKSSLASSLGVNTEQLLLIQPQGMEDTLQAIIDILKSPSPPYLIVVDSIAGIADEEDYEKETFGESMMVKPRLLGKFIPMMIPLLNTSETSLVFINQIRINPSVRFGDNEDFPGGYMLKHSMKQCIRIDKTRKTNMEDRDFSNRKPDYIHGTMATVKADQNLGRDKSIQIKFSPIPDDKKKKAVQVEEEEGEEAKLLKPEAWWYLVHEPSGIKLMESNYSLVLSGFINSKIEITKGFKYFIYENAKHEKTEAELIKNIPATSGTEKMVWE